jgi:hypothetical protein
MIFVTVIDLFSLSFCKFLISSDRSTWSEFAQHYRNQPTVSANDDWETVIKPKYIHPEWGQPQKYDDIFVGKNLDINDLKKIAPKNVSQDK